MSLGHKQIEENPWEVFETVFAVGSSHNATVVKIEGSNAVIALPYGLEGTCLKIQNIALASSEHILKVLGHSNKGDLYNSLCTLDLSMCTFKAYVLESTLLEILNLALTSRKHILKVSGHSTKGDL